jgi:hypothetical protein
MAWNSDYSYLKPAFRPGASREEFVREVALLNERRKDEGLPLLVPYDIWKSWDSQPDAQTLTDEAVADFIKGLGD